MSIFCHPHYYPWCTSTSTLSAVGPPPPPSLPPPPIPLAAPCACQFSYLLSPQGRQTLVIVVVVVNSLNSECKPKLVFICYSQGRSFLIILPQADPHSSLPSLQFHIPTTPFSPNRHSFSHSGCALLQPGTSLTLFLTHHSCSLSFSSSPSSLVVVALALSIRQSMEDGLFLFTQHSCSENRIYTSYYADPFPLNGSVYV